jgi:hypothetical protein
MTPQVVVSQSLFIFVVFHLANFYVVAPLLQKGAILGAIGGTRIDYFVEIYISVFLDSISVIIRRPPLHVLLRIWTFFLYPLVRT